jgi:hypothetical protein
VDIGGRRLHIVQAGQGGPVVVVISALGDSVLTWMDVLNPGAGPTSICVYDRAEIGWSDPPPAAQRTPDPMGRQGPISYVRVAARRQAWIMGIRRLTITLGLARGFSAASADLVKRCHTPQNA